MTRVDPFINATAPELPTWMRRAHRVTDWGALLSLLLGVLAASTFIFQAATQAAPPAGSAFEQYAFRAEDTAQALREGRLYPRWSPHAFAGYGAPIAHFAPPLPAYIPAFITIFLTGDALDAVRLTCILAILASSTAVYALGLRRFGAGAGLLASTLYVFSPYVGLSAPLLLGDLPAVLAAALVPTCLWAADRLVERANGANRLLTSLVFAALLLTSPLLFAVTALLALLLIPAHKSAGRWPLLAHILLAGGLAACYWLPAWVECDSAGWMFVAESLPRLLRFPDVLLPPRPIDPNALISLPPFSIGLALAVGTLFALFTLIRRHLWRDARLYWLLAGVSLLLFTLLMVAEAVTLLIPITLCFALSTTAVLVWSSQTRVQMALMTLTIVATLALAQPNWLTALDTSQRAANTSNQDDAQGSNQIAYETGGNGVAVIPAGERAPSTLAPLLPPDAALISSYASGTINKINAVDANVSGQIGLLAHTTHSDGFQLQVAAASTVTILTMYFPGWYATFADAPVPLYPDPSSGLIRIDLPATGSGELWVEFGATPPRTIAWLITWSALLLLLFFTWRHRATDMDIYATHQYLDSSTWRINGGIIAVFAGVVLLVASPFAPVAILPRPGYVLDSSKDLRARTETGLEALAYNVDPTTFAPGNSLPITIYWRAVRPQPADIQVQWSLLHLDSGTTTPLATPRSPGAYPTQRWSTYRFVEDPYAFTLPEELAPGTYAFAAETWVCAASCDAVPRQQFFNAEGQPIGTQLILPERYTIAP